MNLKWVAILWLFALRPEFCFAVNIPKRTYIKPCAAINVGKRLGVKPPRPAKAEDPITEAAAKAKRIRRQQKRLEGSRGF